MDGSEDILELGSGTALGGHCLGEEGGGVPSRGPESGYHGPGTGGVGQMAFGRTN